MENFFLDTDSSGDPWLLWFLGHGWLVPYAGVRCAIAVALQGGSGVCAAVVLLGQEVTQRAAPAGPGLRRLAFHLCLWLAPD